MIKAMMLKEKDLETFEERNNYVITVVGCGRMGLPTACLFADTGFKVICFDSDPYVVNQINKGESPFSEPKIDEYLKKNLKEGHLIATSDPKEAIPKSDIVAIIVNTPIDKKKNPDYSNLETSCRNVGLNLKQGALVILASTVSPSVTETLVKETLEKSSGMKVGVGFELAYSPIRATAGRVIKDITSYARVVAAIDKQGLASTKTVLQTITKGELIEVKDLKTAEATKLFENIYRDVNIALANELASFCEKAGIDYMKAQKAANTQPFCHLLKPGIVSGHIPKDPYLLISEADNLSVKLKLMPIARRVNDETIKRGYNLIKDALRSCEKPLRRSCISVIGVSYRPNVKESKGSLVLDLVRLLKKGGVRVSVFDPYFTCDELREMGYPAERTFAKTIEGADCLVIAVGHSRFKRLSLRRIKVMMKRTAAIVDLAQIVNPVRAEKEGFVYRGLGRGVWSG